PVRGAAPGRRRPAGEARGARHRRARLLPPAGPPPAGDGAPRRRAARPAGHRGGSPHAPRPADGDGAERAAGRRGDRRVRIWVDLTNSPHVLVMRPLIEAMRADGHEVEVTARDFAQTLQLLERFGMEHTAIGRHRGSGLRDKAAGLFDRSLALRKWARSRRFDAAMGHGSNDISVAAKLLRIPAPTAFDYEWAKVQHNVNCRLCRAVVVPDAIPPERLYRYGARGRIRAYEGLKEEYYLAAFEPDGAVLAELGLEASRPIVVVRTPPEVSLYHRFENDLFRRVLERLRGE